MTNEEKRIAIADACEWRLQHCLYHDTETWHSPEGICADGNSYSVCPDYLNDLNAMHEAEKVLRKDSANAQEYGIQLTKVCAPAVRYGEYSAIEVANVAHATATQRADAFLKTMGLMK